MVTVLGPAGRQALARLLSLPLPDRGSMDSRRTEGRGCAGETRFTKWVLARVGPRAAVCLRLVWDRGDRRHGDPSDTRWPLQSWARQRQALWEPSKRSVEDSTEQSREAYCLPCLEREPEKEFYAQTG